MPFCSYSISSGHSIRNLISSSVALPRNRRFSTALCHWGGGMGYRGLGYFRSRSLDGMACSRPRIAVGRCSLPRCGYGFGVAGTGVGYRGAGFGYKVGGVSRSCTITPITVKEQLLQPLRLEIDPNIQMVKNQEKEQIKTLNNKFVSFIDKVRFLEQQNKVLEIKWSFLQGQNHRKNTITPMLETSIGNLKKQLEALRHNRVQLETELKAAEKVLETNKNMYEDKRSQRTSTESEFIALKKDAECFFSNKAELDAKVKSLKEEIEFLRTFYEEEIHQLQAHISGTTAVVQMNKSRDLNLDGITVDVKARYEDIARKSRAEAQALYENKLEELQVIAGRNANSLRETKNKIAELTQLAQRLNREVRRAKDQRCKLEAAAANAEQTGETAIKDAKHKLSELETALQQTKADLTQQLHEYQDLMNIKLALDVEIFTYRKLLEGEESRLCAEEGFPVNISVHHSHGGLTYSPEPGFARTPASAKRNSCWTSSMMVCGPVVSCSNGVSSKSTRSSHMKVASRTKSARSNM